MSSWNAMFTQLIRRSRRAHWGNWALSAQIQPGAVGIVNPESGEFRLVEETIPGASVKETPVSYRWEVMSENVSRQQSNLSLDGTSIDPETGAKITAGLEMKWGLDKAGSMISVFSITSEAVVDSFGELFQKKMDWLADRAHSVGMGDNGNITQGFGVITSVLFASSGLNVAAESDATTFSLSGSASGVKEFVGEATGKGSYSSAVANKSVDMHLWPDREGTLASRPIPIAYTVCSFDGRRIMPNWTSQFGALQLVLDDANGGTYIVDWIVDYDTPKTENGVVTPVHAKKTGRVSGGLVDSIGDIPLDATNLGLYLAFNGLWHNDHYTFHWDTPLGTWYNGYRHIDLSGVWPGTTHAVDRDASLKP